MSGKELIMKNKINNEKYTYGHDNTNCKTCGITYKDCKCCPEHAKVKDYLIGYQLTIVVKMV